MPDQMPIGTKVRFVRERLIFAGAPGSPAIEEQIRILNAAGWVGTLFNYHIGSTHYPYEIRLGTGVHIRSARQEFDVVEGQELYKISNRLDLFPMEENI